MYWVSQTSFLDDLFTDLNSSKLPDPSDGKVKEELIVLKSLVDELTKDQDALRRYRMFDSSINKYFFQFKFEHDDSLTQKYREIVAELFRDAMPLIYKLKMHYNRQRPFQLAYINKIDLHPISSISANCGAFPSMHACMATLLGEVVGNTFPDVFGHFRNLSTDIIQSRQAMGLCLPHDCMEGIRVAERILSVQEFKVKYRL